MVPHRSLSQALLTAPLVAPLVWGVLSLCPHAWAQQPAKGAASQPGQPGKTASSDPSLPFTRMQLSNGLELLVHEDHTVPIVGVSVWYHVGSKDEVKGKTGFAHLFEHMMFQGSGHVGDDMHFKYINEAGGYLNGTTSEDRTNYFEVVPSNFLERVLYLESDRMGFLLDALSQEKFDNQRDVVRNERRENYEMPPYGMAPRFLAEALYPPGHPYHHLTIGSHGDLAAATLDDVKGFFNRYYVPSNASLVIAGDITTKEARRLCDKWFGPLPRRPVPDTVKSAPMPQLNAEKVITTTDKVTLPRIYYVWPSPPMYRPGDADLDMLAGVLGGKSGRLYKRLVYKERLAQDVSVDQESQFLSSQFTIVATAKEGRSIDEIKRVIDDELGKLRRDPPTQKEMERVKNQHEAQFVYDLQQVGGFSGRTEVLQNYLAFAGDPDYLGKDIQRYRATSAESVRQAAQTWLGPGRVVLMITPGEKPAGETGTGGTPRVTQGGM